MLQKIPIQVRKGIWYYFCSSSSEPEDREGPTGDSSFGNDEEDLNAGPTGEIGREARRPHAPRNLSPIWEREFRRAIRQELLEHINYNINLEEPNGWETRRVESPDEVERPGGDAQETHGPQHQPPETPAGRQTRGER